MDADSRTATIPAWQSAPDVGFEATVPDDCLGYPSEAEMTMEALALAT